MNRPATEIFTRALRIESDARAAFLVETCGDDAELLREVEAMLADAAQADVFFGDDDGRTVGLADLVPPVSEQPGDVFGPYKLLQQIGEGGFGVVWMAEQNQPILRKVALKVIKAGMDTKQVLARFEAERQALAMMDHPNIARVIDAGATPAGRPYFAMELVHGIPITEFCDQKQLDTRQRLELFRDVCSAVNHAHQKGIIHRDLKPSNVMVSRGVDFQSTSAAPGGLEVHATAGAAERPHVKVIDFGIAKATEQKLTDKTLFTRFEQFLGTPAYMSPEQAAMSAADIDTRTDIYSLGMLLYELLAGRPAFDPKTLMAAGYDEMRRIIREVEPPRPSVSLAQSARTTAKPPVARRSEAADDALPRATPSAKASRLAPDHDNPPQERRATGLITRHLSLSSDLDWIVMKALEKDRTRRYETANALAADIQRHLTNEPVMARPASKAYRLQKAFRRNKLAFTAFAAVAVAITAGAIVSTWQTIEASRARDAEKEQRLTGEQERLRAERGELKARQIAYASDMNLAHQAVKEDDFYRALQLLDRHRPPSEKSEDRERRTEDRRPRTGTREQLPDRLPTFDLRHPTSDLRGWEWRYLWRQCQGEERFILGEHPGGATAVGMLADGKTVFSAGRDKCVRLWDLESRRQIGLLPHAEEVIGAAASPDGRWLATASSKKAEGQPVLLWDLTTQKDLATQKPVPLTSEFWLRPGSITFSPDSKWLAFATHFGGVRLWEVNARTGVTNLEASHPSHEPLGVAFSPDSLTLAYNENEEGAIVLWDLASRLEIGRLNGHQDFVSAIAFSPDGKTLASGSRDRTARLWNLSARQEVFRIPNPGGAFTSLAFSPPDGRTLAMGGSGGAGRVIRLVDVETGSEKADLRGHLGDISGLVFTPDGQTLLSASNDGTVRVWDAAPGANEKIDHAFDSNSISTDWKTYGPALCLSPDGRHLLTVYTNQTFSLWDTLRLTEGERHPLPFTGTTIAAVASGGRMAAFGSESGEVMLWDAETGQARPFAQPVTNRIMRLVFSLDGRYMAAFNSPKPFSPDGSFIAVPQDSRSVRVWDVVSRKETHVFSTDGEAAMSLTLSADAGALMAGFWKGSVKLWQLDGSGRADTFYEHSWPVVGGLALLPDGQTLISAAEDIRFWAVGTRRETTKLHPGAGLFSGSALSADGRRLAAGASDGRITIWDVASHHEVATLEGHKEEVMQLAFTPDGDHLVSVSKDQLRVWRAASPAEADAAEKEGSK